MKTIEIINPYPGGSAYTSVKKAAELVARGRARWNGNQIEFIDRVHDRRPSRDTESVVSHIAVIDRWAFPHTQWLTAEAVGE